MQLEVLIAINTQGGKKMRIEGSMDAFTMPILNQGSREAAPAPTPAPAPEMPRKASSVEKMHAEGEKTARIRELKKEMSEDEFMTQMQDANKKLKLYDRRLEFSIHESTRQIMVKVINTNDDTVIREIPSEKALDMLAYFWKLSGILLDERR